MTDYVGRTLIPRIMKSEDLTKIVELTRRAKAMEGVASTAALGNRIDEKVRVYPIISFHHTSPHL